jgi:hypothetical protein
MMDEEGVEDGIGKMADCAGLGRLDECWDRRESKLAEGEEKVEVEVG